MHHEVVQVHHTSRAGDGAKNTLHEAFKSGRAITQAKWHDLCLCFLKLHQRETVGSLTDWLRITSVNVVLYKVCAVTHQVTRSKQVSVLDQQVPHRPPLFPSMHFWDNFSRAEAVSGDVPSQCPWARHKIRGPPASPYGLLCTVRAFST